MVGRDVDAVGCYLSQSSMSKSCQSQEKSLKGVTLTLIAKIQKSCQSHVSPPTPKWQQQFQKFEVQYFNLGSEDSIAGSLGSHSEEKRQRDNDRHSHL
jgi:hypothetical protein